ALLEGDRAGEGERPCLGEPPGEEALQHHRALLLDRPAELDVALDVDDPDTPGGGARRDAPRRPEAAVAGVLDGQRIDLADRAAARRDHDGALDNAADRPILDAGAAPT